MADRDEVIALLRELVAVNRAILAAVGPTSSAAHPSQAVAGDRELDSQYGNPEIRGKDPRDWNGPTMRGRKFSECPAEYLELLAESLEWQAGQAEKKDERTNGGKPVAEYRRKDAARARGWAARVRAGRVPPGTHELRYEPEPGPRHVPEPEFASSDFTPSNWNE